MNIHDHLVILKENPLPLEDIHLSQENRAKIDQILKEFQHFDTLEKYDLPISNKILLSGYTGCGKTTTARSLAKALDKKILVPNLGTIVSSRLGETAQQLSAIFRKANREKSVLFLDEFDYFGKKRAYGTKDSGEMTRLVNTIIQLIDSLSNNVVLITATNHIKVIDEALIRRFEIRLDYTLPTNDQLDNYYDQNLEKYPKKWTNITRVYGISYAEAKDQIHNEVKKSILSSNL